MISASRLPTKGGKWFGGIFMNALHTILTIIQVILAVGLVVIVIITLFAVFGPIFCPYGYEDADFFHVNEWPSKAHWFGTDALGCAAAV